MGFFENVLYCRRCRFSVKKFPGRQRWVIDLTYGIIYKGTT